MARIGPVQTLSSLNALDKWRVKTDVGQRNQLSSYRLDIYLQRIYIIKTLSDMEELPAHAEPH